MESFTKEEIESAKAVKEKLLNGDYPPDLKSIYMAGEIVMWDELNQMATLTDEDIRKEADRVQSIGIGALDGLYNFGIWVRDNSKAIDVREECIEILKYYSNLPKTDINSFSFTTIVDKYLHDSNTVIKVKESSSEHYPQ